MLTNTVNYYNELRRTCRKVEYNLIELDIARIDSLIQRGQDELQWNSDCLLDYMSELGSLVQDLHKRVKAAQANVEKIRAILEPWMRSPLIERKDRRKDTLLALEERPERVNKRYAEIKKAAVHINELLEENKKLFEITDDRSEAWQTYVGYVDRIIVESLRKALGCSLSYLAESMDPSNQSDPLLEASLELREPELYFVPSLEPDDPDGLDQLVAGLLTEIIGMARLVTRLKANAEGYADELEKDEDICAMKNEILTSVTRAVDEATDFCGIFEGKLFILYLEELKVIDTFFFSQAMLISG